jgi:homoserine O-acetyltransferase
LQQSRRTDLYFPVADNALEMQHLTQAELRPIPSIWGHVAGSPAPDRGDFSFLRAAVRSWLE